MPALLELIRKKASDRVWSRGVELARRECVLPARGDEDELNFKVMVPGAGQAFEVQLWPQDKDWACDCDGPDPCVHICAAAIWNTQRIAHGSAPGDAPAGERPGPKVARFAYRCRREANALVLDRLLVMDQVETVRNEGPVASIKTGLPLLIEDCDREVERALSFHFGGRIPKEAAHRVWDALQGANELTLDGEPVQSSGQPVIPIGRVEDDGKGFKVRIVRDRAITEVLGSGSVLCGDTIRPIGDGGLSPEKRQLLTRGVNFPPEEVGRLVAETIPTLRQSIPVEVRTARLPTGEAQRPRLLIETWGSQEELVVKPRLVYGTPPSAEVERGELKLLGGMVPIRDEPAERKLVRSLADGLQLALGIERRLRGEEAVRFAAALAQYQGGSRGSVALDGAAHRQFRRVASLTPDVRIEGDKLFVSFKGAEGEADASRVIEAWQEGSELAPLVGGGWAPIPHEWLAAHGQRVADLLAAREANTGKVARGAIFDLARLSAELDQPVPPGLEELRTLVGDFAGIPTAPLPEDLRATLRPYQQQGVDWLRFLQRAGLGGILADDMGLGKTLQLLTLLAGVFARAPASPPALVVAPVTLLDNWTREISRFFRPGTFRVLTLYGQGLKDLRARPDEIDQPLRQLGLTRFLRPGWRADCQLVLTTYETLRDYEFSLARELWSVLICDEAQKIKSPAALVTQAAKAMNARFKIASTGTPVENSLTDLWCLFDFVQPGLLGALNEFGRKYKRPIEAKTVREEQALEELNKLFAPQVLRRTKSEVASLPAKIEDKNCRELRLSPLQRRLYAAALSAHRQKIEACDKQKVGQAMLGMLQHLRLLCAHPVWLGQTVDTTQPMSQALVDSPKLSWLMGALEGIRRKGEKVIIFTELREIQRVVQHYIGEQFGQRPVVINGSSETRPEKDQSRQRLIDQFQAQEGFGVIILSTQAVGFGLNIQKANHVIHYTRCWNPAKEDQATDRVYRIGQAKEVTVYYPTVRAEDYVTFEERLGELLTSKRDLAAKTWLNGAEDIDLNQLAELKADGSGLEFLAKILGEEEIRTIQGYELESLCALLWGKQGFHTYQTPLSGDGGVDVVGLRGHDGVLIQCKASSNQCQALGWGAIKDVSAGAKAYMAKHEAVRFTRIAVTNQRFNKSAKIQAALLGVRLIERQDLLALLDAHPVTVGELASSGLQ